MLPLRWPQGGLSPCWYPLTKWQGPGPNPPPPQTGRARHVVRAQTLGTPGDPPGDTCSHQEASKKEQKIPKDLLATRKKP